MAIQQMGGNPMDSFQMSYNIGSKPNALGTAILTVMERVQQKRAAEQEMGGQMAMEQFKQDIKPTEWKPQSKEEAIELKSAGKGTTKLSKLPPMDTGEKAGKKIGPFTFGRSKGKFTPAEVELMRDIRSMEDLEDLVDSYLSNPEPYEKAQIDVENIIKHYKELDKKGKEKSSFETF